MILGSGRSPGEDNGNPLRYSCLENSTDRGAWQATVHGMAESDTTEQHTHTHTHTHTSFDTLALETETHTHWTNSLHKWYSYRENEEWGSKNEHKHMILL